MRRFGTKEVEGGLEQSRGGGGGGAGTGQGRRGVGRYKEEEVWNRARRRRPATEQEGGGLEQSRGGGGLE